MFLKNTDNLQRSLIAIFGITILSILILTLLAYIQSRTEQENREMASLGNEQIILVQSLVRSVVQAEASQRAYFLSGEAVYKNEVQDTVIKLGDEMAKLDRLDASIDGRSA